MGWCSATRIFDSVCEALLSSEKPNKKEVLMKVVSFLEDNDWDCQQDSSFWDHPVVEEIMKELHPYWFEDEQ